MDQESLSVNTEEKKSRKPRYNAEEHIKALEGRIDNLEECLIRIATLAGQGNQLASFGFKAWQPNQKSMRKYN